MHGSPTCHDVVIRLSHPQVLISFNRFSATPYINWVCLPLECLSFLRSFSCNFTNPSLYGLNVVLLFTLPTTSPVDFTPLVNPTNRSRCLGAFWPPVWVRSWLRSRVVVPSGWRGCPGRWRSMSGWRRRLCWVKPVVLWMFMPFFEGVTGITVVTTKGWRPDMHEPCAIFCCVSHKVLHEGLQCSFLN